MISGAVLATALAPIWMTLALAIDLFRRPRTALRCGLFFLLFLWCEALGVLISLAIWLASGAGCAGEWGRERCQRGSLWLQIAWARTLFEIPARLFGFRLEVEGEEVLAEAPYLLFPRHVSMADTLLPTVSITHPHGIRLRYVLKRELLWDPCLDIIGKRLPNYFARRNSSDSERERRGVAALAHGLGSREGVLIYPEGTRFTPTKRARVLQRLRERGLREPAARAESLQHVLPPRLGGALALIDASPGTDTVFCAHAGFERVVSFSDLWNGALVGAVLRVRFWRVRAAEIPSDRAARITWFHEQWERMDRNVGELRLSPP